MSDKLAPTKPTEIVDPKKVDEISREFVPYDLNVNRVSTIYRVLHMTPEMAETEKAVANYRYAIPAIEETKQAGEATKQAQEVTRQAEQTTAQTVQIHAVPAQEKTKQARQHTWRLCVVGVCFGLAAYLSYKEPKVAVPLMGGVVIFGGAVTIPEAIKNARKPRD